eukprot:m.122653 g.122653  ORF g.122653 m.122653 type:complete len:635 (-) comp14427_c0_seq11:3753-5657(-)
MATSVMILAEHKFTSKDAANEFWTDLHLRNPEEKRVEQDGLGLWNHAILPTQKDKGFTSVWEIKSKDHLAALSTYLDREWPQVKSVLSEVVLGLTGGFFPFLSHFDSQDTAKQQFVTRADMEEAIQAAIEPLQTSVRLLASHLHELDADFETKADAKDLEAVSEVLDVDLEAMREFSASKEMIEDGDIFGNDDELQQIVPEVPTSLVQASSNTVLLTPEGLEKERRLVRQVTSSISVSSNSKSVGKILIEAVRTLNHAVACDNEQQYADALEWYLIGTQYLMTGWKYTTDNGYKVKLREKLMECMDRANIIRTFLEDLESSAKSQELRSAMEALKVVEKPNVEWSSIVGLEEAKEALQGIHKSKKGPSSVMLYGPAGSGKQLLAKAVGSEVNAAAFISVSAAATLAAEGDWEPSVIVKELFAFARELRPCVVYIKDIESMCSASDKREEAKHMKSVEMEFLHQLEESATDNTGIMVIGSTRKPWDVDKDMLQRFEKVVYVPPPDASALKAMYTRSLGELRHNITDEHIHELADHFAGRMSGRDVNKLMQDVVYQPIRKLQAASHFKPIPGDKEIWTPCDPDDLDAKAASWQDFDGSVLMEPSIGVDDIKAQAKDFETEIDKQELERIMHWATDD